MLCPAAGEIARLALKRGLIKCSGKTPEATMASALYTDIKRREGQSVFIRPHEGLFGLREWIDQGVPFQVCVGWQGDGWVGSCHCGACCKQHDCCM